MQALYRFNHVFGRMGEVEDIVTLDAEQLDLLVGSMANFGECLGKHSEVVFEVLREDFTLLTDDQDFIGKARQYGLLDAGDDVVGAVFDGEYVHNYCNRDEDDEELTAEENERKMKFDKHFPFYAVDYA